MNEQERQKLQENVAEWLANHTYTCLVKANGVEVWRCKAPKTTNLAFDITITRFGMAVMGDIGALSFHVGASYGIEFLAHQSDGYLHEKLESTCKETEPDPDSLVETVYEAIRALVDESQVEQPEWLAETESLDDRVEELQMWLSAMADADSNELLPYDSLNNALDECQALDGETTEGLYSWLHENETLLDVGEICEITLHRTTGSLWRRLYYVRHAATQILKQQAQAAERAAETQYAYCLDKGKDHWSDDDIAVIVSDEELSDGAVISRGVVIRSSASDFLPDAGDIFEHMANQASDQNSEYCDNFPDESEAQKAELTKLLEPIKAWADRTFPVNFYNVEKMEPYMVTAEDVEAARAYERTRDLAAAGAA